VYFDRIAQTEKKRERREGEGTHLIAPAATLGPNQHPTSVLTQFLSRESYAIMPRGLGNGGTRLDLDVECVVSCFERVLGVVPVCR
jgi:hypothetical protein